MCIRDRSYAVVANYISDRAQKKGAFVLGWVTGIVGTLILLVGLINFFHFDGGSYKWLTARFWFNDTGYCFGLSDVYKRQVMNGTELCRQIKTNMQWSHIPVILLTARMAEEYKSEGFEPVSYTHLDVYKRQPLCCITKWWSIKMSATVCAAITFKKKRLPR